MATGISNLNRALSKIPKRAEQQQAQRLRETFSDSGASVAIEAIDHQIIYGRRGTGKTHALRYFESECLAQGDIAVFADLRTIGSPEGLFMGAQVSETERAARLLVDLLGHIHEQILELVLSDDDLLADHTFVESLDQLADAITTVRIAGQVEHEEADSINNQNSFEGSANLGISTVPSITAKMSSGDSRSSNNKTRRTGTEYISLNFREVATAMRKVSECLNTRRLWLLLDEWGNVPPEIQPLLGEFLVRCVLPLQKISVKIAAIEQQTNFRASLQGQLVGLELGADISANINLDEFMVYEQHEERSFEFFRSLFFKHLTRGQQAQEIPIEDLATEQDVVRLGFTERRAFAELARASEGVPRDAINIAAKAAMRAGTNKISVNDVRYAARAWFQHDKEAALKAAPEAKRLLDWIIDQVIRGKKARGFLVNQRETGAALLLGLFEARVLHIVRKGYSAQDEPGERYDVWVIDYGAYVDLMQTKNAPQAFLFDTELEEDITEVPFQDLRGIRRAVLDLAVFEQQTLTTGSE